MEEFKKQSFTLIELIMVIIIIGILAAIAIPRFIDLRSEANRATCQGDVQALRGALFNWYSQGAINRGCPSGVNTDCDASGYPVDAQLQDDDSYFADNFMSNAALPSTTHITGASADWSDYYDPSVGSIDLDAACP